MVISSLILPGLEDIGIKDGNWLIISDSEVQARMVVGG